MGFIGLIRLIALLLAVWLLWRFLTRRGSQRSSGAIGNERMVECAWCHTHVPENDALEEDGQWFCSEQHRDNLQEDA